MKDPTIYDVAESANVSITTVSRVLNTPHQVREKTRQKVLAAIEALKFVPKAEATDRARKRFGKIGVLTPHLTMPSFVERLRGIADTLHATKYELIVYSVENNEQLQHYVDMLSASKRVDGLIVMTLPVDETALKRLQAQKIEIVCIEVPNPLCSTITVNNFWGGVLAAQHFVDKGYRRFAYIGEPFQISADLGTGNSEKRLKGFQAGLQDNGMRLHDEYICLAVSHSIDAAIEQTQYLLDLPKPPDALFTYSDLCAIGALKVLRQRKMHAPEDLAIVGFDNIDAADFVELTTVDQSLEQSGKLATEVLLSRLEGKIIVVQNIELQAQLVERGTT
ncbi:LacI family transcriptional regulator [candidate division KSB3 bacterium]|uniref:LacI family transcriptional regulator n=1 Tax=candidate division KSB3 bacterium TaxID=2044937 RepID=A0A2G6KGR1_9BACT|nr:MAG: LacI family transcriptional regulator [candidate division KSB3 bacterium]